MHRSGMEIQESARDQRSHFWDKLNVWRDRSLQVGILVAIVQRMTLEEPALGYEFLEKAVMSLPERISVIRLEKSDLGWLYLKAWDAAKNGFRKPLDLFNSKLGS